jgi:Lipocalin-like domain
MSGHLVGVWQLESWTARDSRGNVEKPFGEHPTGVLVITADGWMSVHVAASDRPDFPTRSNPFGKPDEHAAAFVGYISYAGRYRTDGGRLVTTVQVSSIPNWVGSEQVRDLEFARDSLVLRPPVVAVPTAPDRSEQLAPAADEQHGEAQRAARQVEALARTAPLRNDLVWRRVA